MSMTTAAYLRVSTGQQSIDQQHDAIAAAGITPDRVFTDTASGRAGSNRPGWIECMGYLREGDHLVVVAVDRLGRSVREVATALHELTSRGVHVRSLREGVDTSTPTGRAVTSIMATTPSWNSNSARSAAPPPARRGSHADWPPPNR
jgi:DNA invertase Pin-like site-specific DNA recombinase